MKSEAVPTENRWPSRGKSTAVDRVRPGRSRPRHRTMGSEAFVAAGRQSLGNVCVQDARRSTRVCRRLSPGPERRSTISAGFTGQSRPHFRQHHVTIAARPLMVVSSAMEPTAAQKMQRAGTVNRRSDTVENLG